MQTREMDRAPPGSLDCCKPGGAGASRSSPGARLSDITFRRAVRADLPEIVALLADDAVNGHREKTGEPLQPGYVKAFEAITSDPNNVLIVGEIGGAPVATAQVTFIPNLTQQGGMRAIVEGVRVSSTVRSQGIGEKLMAYMTALAQERGCVYVQLTTSKARIDAHRFYDRIGFVHSHLGFKRDLK